MTTVLLTDPDQRATLAAARALARSGHRVVTLGHERGLAGVSRATARHVSITSAVERDRVAYLAAVTAAIHAEHVDVVLPVTDATSRVLLGARDALSVPVAGPSFSAYTRASDKEGLLQIAESQGMSTPRQHVVKTSGDARVIIDQLRFPLVVKPSRSVVEVDGAAMRQGVQFVSGASELTRVLDAYPNSGYPLLLQERTRGPGIGVFLLRTNRSTLLQFGHRRLREKPPAGGVSTYRESMVPPPELVASCERLLDALDYDGAAMIEFKQDAETGQYILMEINARLWGSLQLAIDAGVDFPTMLVALALGRQLPSVPCSRAGVRSYWELGEVDHALALLRRSRDELHVPQSVPVGAKAAWHALIDHRFADRHEVFQWSDPLPFASELARWLLNR